MGEVKLLSSWSSPFVLRIVWALKLKGIEYESIEEDLSNKSSLLVRYNPVYKKVPVLVHNHKPISESLLILEYIEETWNQNPLLPQDSYERARARFWVKFIDDRVFRSVWGAYIKEGKEQEEAITPAIQNLKMLEELKEKKFFGGERIGMVDFALGWMANMVSVLEEVSGLKMINEEIFPMLIAWMHKFSEVPIIKQSWPPRDRLVIKFGALQKAYLTAPAAPPK